MEQIPNQSYKSTQQNTPIATASCPTDHICSVDDLVIMVFVNTSSSFKAPVLSQNSRQKTLAPMAMAEAPCRAGWRRMLCIRG